MDRWNELGCRVCVRRWLLAVVVSFSCLPSPASFLSDRKEVWVAKDMFS
jgi:hypothetical protein